VAVLLVKLKTRGMADAGNALAVVEGLQGIPSS
jgi:hypothetical protein